MNRSERIKLQNASARRTRRRSAIRGQALGNLLMSLKEDADLTDADLGSAAGISASTVQQILSGSIDCPPRSRLVGFAEALGVSTSRLITAAETDGCSYDD